MEERSHFGAFIRGEMSLPVTYLKGILHAATIGAGGLFLISVFTKPDTIAVKVMFSLWIAAIGIWAIIVWIAVWRSARNYQGPAAVAWAARGLITIGLFLAAWRVFSFLTGFRYS